jgi:threonine/homoserine efflux transporter RhtA
MKVWNTYFIEEEEEELSIGGHTILFLVVPLARNQSQKLQCAWDVIVSPTKGTIFKLIIPYILVLLCLNKFREKELIMLFL